MRLLVLAFFFLLNAATAQEPEQKISEKNAATKDERFPDGQVHDFGTVARGTHAKHAFRIVNTADSPIQIVSVRTHGVTALMDKDELPPKAEGKLLVTVDTSRFVGRKTVTIFLSMKKMGTAEEFRFWITCNSDEDLKLDPKVLLQKRLMEAACKGVDVNRDGFPPSPGVYLGDASTPNIATVLKEGADVNMPDQRGCTALMYAAICGLPKNVKTLLANCADATLKDNDGWTALALAEAGHGFRVEGRREVAKVLKAHLAKMR